MNQGIPSDLVTSKQGEFQTLVLGFALVNCLLYYCLSLCQGGSDGSYLIGLACFI